MQVTESPFGALLKDWRGQRRMSQLDLGLAANVSARHISFLETGRARPSRSMVIQLTESLEVPRGARNALLNAAGFSPAYRSRNLDEADMAHVRAAVDWTLERHDPFPAFALDRHWRLVAANQSAGVMLGTLGLAVGESMLDAFVESEALRAAIDNWDEVARHVTARLRTESAHLGGDAVLDGAAEAIARGAGGGNHDLSGTLPAVIPARYRANGVLLSFFSTIAQFGSAEDITLADLKIEFLFPADDETRNMLLANGEGSGHGGG